MGLNKQVLILPALLLALSVALTACGDNELSLAEYTERIDSAATVAGEGGEELFAEAADMVDVTPAQLQAFLERSLGKVRIPLQKAVDELSPPDQLADLHNLMWDWHAGFITAEQAVASRVAEIEAPPPGGRRSPTAPRWRRIELL